MIQSAMIFALGVFVSGLVWLAFSVALVRRARRLTERRLLAGIAVRRAEFETERDELRARHAVQMHRLEREVSRVLDMATAHRLEADLKERDLVNARAELVADEEDFVDIERRLSAEREMIQDLERRHAEVGAALRSAQHALKLEAKRRASAEEALDEATLLADQRRLALIVAPLRERHASRPPRRGARARRFPSSSPMRGCRAPTASRSRRTTRIAAEEVEVGAAAEGRQRSAAPDAGASDRRSPLDRARRKPQATMRNGSPARPQDGRIARSAASAYARRHGSRRRQYRRAGRAPHGPAGYRRERRRDRKRRSLPTRRQRATARSTVSLRRSPRSGR